MSGINVRPNWRQASAITVAEIRWHLSTFGSEILTPDSLDLANLQARELARVVKHGPHRTVHHVVLDNGNFFWKHCRINGIRAFLRVCIRPPKARLEFDRAIALAQRGIATLEPLAWGVQCKFFGESHLITREIAGAVSLQQYLFDHFETESTPSPRRDLANLLGRFLARVHEAGAAHPDLHPGNILVTNDADGKPRFHLIDLHDILLGRSLSFRDSLENLVLINRWFIQRASRTDRLRFWIAYLKERGWDAREAACELERHTIRSNQAFWQGRFRRCLGTNRYFHRVCSIKANGFAVREFNGPTLQRFLDDPDFPFRDPACRLLKDSATSSVAEITVLTPNGPVVMIYKRFRLKKKLAALVNRFRMSPALRSWTFGHALRDRGLPTPRPWLVLHRRGWIGPREGYLLCEKVENAVAPNEVIETTSRWDLIEELARLIRRFHDAGLLHRDLKVANLLCTPEAPSGNRLHFIDLVGVTRVRRASESKQARNLSRLNASFLQSAQITRTDRLRFLRAYLQWGLRGQGGWEKWWSLIAEATQRKVERNKRSGRPLA
ncbi:MAG: lipopolysaccharide kinase InaA family protein [Planctomycetes bacterium]|nr:lipopolysaccharide kinase InaA family protein [Planctomycetota bacterium]